MIRIQFLRWIITLIALLEVPVMYSQSYEVAYNGKEIIGYASGDVNLKERWTLTKIMNQNTEVAIQYAPITSMETMKSNLKKVPAFFSEVPYANEDSFVSHLFEAYQKATLLKDMPMYELPWVQFALGLGFAETTSRSPDEWTYELHDSRSQLKHVATPSQVVSDRQPTIRQKPGFSAGEPAFSWFLTDYLPGSLLSFKIYRTIKGTEAPLEEIPALGGFSVVGDSLFFNVRDTSLTDAGIYVYVVQAYDRFARLSKPSEPFDFYFQVEEEPILYLLTAKGAEDSPSVHLRWKITKSHYLKSISIQRSRFFEGPFETVGVVPPGDTSYTDVVTDVMEAYFYRVALLDRFDRSINPSVVVPVISAFAQEVPTPRLASAESFANGIKVVWPCEDPLVRGYYVFRKPEGSAVEWSQVSTFLSYNAVDSSMTFIDTSEFLRGDIWYEYAIQAESHAYMKTNYSNSRVARPDVIVPAEPVSGLTIRKMDDGTFLMTWEDVQMLDPYLSHYQFGTRTEQFGATIWRDDLKIPATQNYYEMKDPSPNLYYTVRAVNVFGHFGSPGLPVNIPGYLTQVTGPEYLMGVTLPDRKISLRWNPIMAENLTGYRLYKLGEDGSPTIVTTIDKNQSKLEYDLDQSGSFLFAMSAVYENGKESPLSEVILLEID